MTRKKKKRKSIWTVDVTRRSTISSLMPTLPTADAVG
jgi:hypothetical protein